MIYYLLILILYSLKSLLFPKVRQLQGLNRNKILEILILCWLQINTDNINSNHIAVKNCCLTSYKSHLILRCSCIYLLLRIDIEKNLLISGTYLKENSFFLHLPWIRKSMPRTFSYVVDNIYFSSCFGGQSWLC